MLRPQLQEIFVPQDLQVGISSLRTINAEVLNFASRH